MAIFRPFRGIRPRKELAHKVAALPYDVMNSNEAREMVKDNPDSFLHVDRAEVDLDPSIDIYDRRVYEKARENLEELIRREILIQDEEERFYIYKQIMNGREQIGLVGCASIDDYLGDTIKKHEHTREEKEQDRINHVDYTDANTGPIFMTYRSKDEINRLVEDLMDRDSPIYDFVSEDGISHIVWIVNDMDAIQRLIELFHGIDYLYIADGHHRSASAVKVGLKRRRENPDYSGSEEFNFFLSVLFPDDQLHIMDYNRVVKDLNGYSTEDFLKKIEEKFEVEFYNGEESYSPKKKHSFGMYLEDKWYILNVREGTFNQEDPVERLDVSILQKNILEPILGICDPRTDNRIDFIGGIRGLKELERRVSTDMKVAFSMYPTSIEDLMTIADEGKIMPPKSTWFEPKLRSGLFIHKLS